MKRRTVRPFELSRKNVRPLLEEIDQYQGALKKTQKVKVNAQGYSHLPTHLMVSVDRYDNYLSKKVSLGTQIFIFCQIWQFKKQYYEKVNKFWLVSYEIEQAPTYEKSHSAPRVS